MICPNCGSYHNPEDIFCPACHCPLSNASFTQLEISRPKATRKKGHKMRWFIFFLFFLAFLGFAGREAYCYYMNNADIQCRKKSNEIMKAATNLNLSAWQKEGLPESYVENPNAKDHISNAVKGQLTSKMQDAISETNLDMDYDSIYSLIQENASYSIDEISVSPKQCQVKVSVSNLNIPEIIKEMGEDIPEEEDQDEDSWWGQFTSWFGNQQTELTLPDQFSTWMENHMSDKDIQTTTGILTFGFKKGKWVLLSSDAKLFSSLYGFPQ